MCSLLVRAEQNGDFFLKVVSMLISVLDEVCDCDQLDSMFLGELVAIIAASHGSVTIIDQFTDDSHGLKLGKYTQIYRGFGMSSTAQRSSLRVTKRQDVSWSVKVLGGLGGISKGAACQCAVMSRDTRCSVVGIIHRDCVGSLHQLLIVGNHQWQLEFL